MNQPLGGVLPTSTDTSFLTNEQSEAQRRERTRLGSFWVCREQSVGGEAETQVQMSCLLICPLPPQPPTSSVGRLGTSTPPNPMPQTRCGSRTIIFFTMVFFSPPSSTSWLFWRVMAFSTSGAAEGKAKGESCTEPSFQGLSLYLH